MLKNELLEIGKETLEGVKEDRVSKASVERVLEDAQQVLFGALEVLEVGEKLEVFGLQFERVEVPAKQGEMVRPDGSRIPYSKEATTKIKVKALKAVKEL